MTCTRCSHQFCWLCLATYAVRSKIIIHVCNDYNHNYNYLIILHSLTTGRHHLASNLHEFMVRSVCMCMCVYVCVCVCVCVLIMCVCVVYKYLFLPLSLSLSLSHTLFHHCCIFNVCFSLFVF